MLLFTKNNLLKKLKTNISKKEMHLNQSLKVNKVSQSAIHIWQGCIDPCNVDEGQYLMIRCDIDKKSVNHN